jgi:hypothetical protein
MWKNLPPKREYTSSQPPKKTNENCIICCSLGFGGRGPSQRNHGGNMCRRTKSGSSSSSPHSNWNCTLRVSLTKGILIQLCRYWRWGYSSKDQTLVLSTDYYLLGVDMGFFYLNRTELIVQSVLLLGHLATPLHAIEWELLSYIK